jgi:hypothetical protein
MVNITLEDNFIVVIYEDWDATDFGRCCDEVYKILQNSSTPLYFITQTKTNPKSLNVVKAVTVYRKEIERMHNHPLLLRPVMLVLTPFMTPITRTTLKLPWLKKYTFGFSNSIEEAKATLNSITPYKK